MSTDAADPRDRALRVAWVLHWAGLVYIAAILGFVFLLAVLGWLLGWLP